MSKKLLNKTTGNFLRFSVVVLIISAPVFYFVSHWLYVYETDEILQFHKNAFVEHNLDTFTADDIDVWNRYNRDVAIVPDRGIKKDSIFGMVHFDSLANENIPFRELWAPVTIDGKKYTYIEKNNLVEMEDMVYTIAIMFILIIIILLIGIILLSNRLARQIWSPFYDTLRQIQNFEIDKNKTPQFAATSIEEFDTLNKSIERLIEKNTLIYNNQREFVENAAHELQTPLALFQAKIDTLFQLDNITDEQSLIIGALNEDVSRLNRLNKNLLLLSKIENDNYFEKQPVAIDAYINKNLDFFTEQAKAKNISVTAIFRETSEINANAVLTEVLVNNLFLNAIRHNTTGGSITITTSGHALSFTNTGKETPLNIDKLFNRFSKSDPSAQGNGLGLAIVKKICDINSWKITYAFKDDMHSFTIDF
jgi:signal transduction histidine kinase